MLFKHFDYHLCITHHNFTSILHMIEMSMINTNCYFSDMTTNFHFFLFHFKYFDFWFWLGERCCYFLWILFISLKKKTFMGFFFLRLGKGNFQSVFLVFCILLSVTRFCNIILLLLDKMFFFLLSSFPSSFSFLFSFFT